MRIRLLGTGSADGWPNPFCECASCASERAAGRSRGPASALVDGRVLIDCGPGVTRAASRARESLADVEHLLLTHGHPDHLDPGILLARHWSGLARPLHVWGPAHALDLCRDWLAPGDPVVLHVVRPGDQLDLPSAAGAYEVSVLAAAHSSGNGDRLADEAVLYALTGPDGRCLLYATDTGPLPAPGAARPAPAVDVLLLDETFGDTLDHGTGHLDLATLPRVLAEWQLAGVVGPGTRLIATHMSHHNPPTPTLRARLGAMGVEVPEDLDVIDTERPDRRTTLVLGGARSGKSRHAESLAGRWSSDITYVATGGSDRGDADWARRVAEHRARRPQTWATVETTDLPAALAEALPGSVVLIDCLTLWLTAQLDAMDAWARMESGEHEAVDAEVVGLATDLATAVQSSPAAVILVSNEVGWGVVPATSSGRAFRDHMGRVNAIVASACSDTILVVAGRPIALGGPESGEVP